MELMDLETSVDLPVRVEKERDRSSEKDVIVENGKEEKSGEAEGESYISFPDFLKQSWVGFPLGNTI